MAKPHLTKSHATWARVAAVLPVAVAVLAACTTNTPQPSGPTGVLPARARYLAYAAPPVDHFTWLGHYDGWEALSDDELVLFLSPTRAYYIKVWAPCGTRGGFRWIWHVGLTNTGGAVYTRFDSVLADHWRCPISELRPIDWGRMKADARAAHQALPGPPPQTTSPPPSGARGSEATPPPAGEHPGGGPPPDSAPPTNPQ
jgi:hypothetical protein